MKPIQRTNILKYSHKAYRPMFGAFVERKWDFHGFIRKGVIVYAETLGAYNATIAQNVLGVPMAISQYSWSHKPSEASYLYYADED